MNTLTAKRARNLTLNVVTWLFVLVNLFPILWMVWTSIHSNEEILGGVRAMTLDHLQWGNYLQLWQTINYFGYFKNSLLICGATTILSTAFAVMAGYALARFKFPGSNLFGMSVVSTQMIPGILFLVPIYLLFWQIDKNIGLPMINTYWGMILIYTAFYTPMSIWIMRSFFVSVPRDLEESALIDGCTRFQAFRKVILPLSVPGIIATAVYVFLTAWDELMFAWVMTTTSDVQTIPVGIRLYVGQYQNRFDLLMAAAAVSTLPVLLTFFLTQKYFIRGMTAGAVKG
ncbi:carbohydrate ABC transporter permease [Tumebacillus permanentifrigoris]|uniref:Multiple sugar transport system permease protein n=1 Tax=Tumebacillus permanentifrigoris TaxID=378543 RepID=A0A316DFA1_9BACL|nr:carbohydrate ABC transporter permease [Tumebacillus permanentifrigoris]PWK14914.1 multiple sugar transport system permease protein [Tumebacillus permanentifrigoris]